MLKNLQVFTALILVLANFHTVKAEPVKLSYNSDWPPYSSGVGKSVAGILPNVMREIIEKRMGFRVLQTGSPWKRVQLQVKKGLSDAFVTVPTKTRLDYAYSSNNIVYSLEMRAIVKKDSTAHDSLKNDPGIQTFNKLRVCDILGNGFAKNFYGKHKIDYMTASNVQACLRMENIGRADVLIQPMATATSAIKSFGLEKVLITLPKIYAQMDFTLLLSKKSNLGAGFIKKFDAALTQMKKDGSYNELLLRLRKNN
ncbi:MAG: transporter substrate-binding domain-containing protein [Rhodospirillaceae bacterium]|jgi:polar amino acid transport system substrate-binding protein|nr:transporter substrate-binding domain-containing protein [Rhodospirillaceae bacterium]MBT4940646.1 transporter substrate-binding domain-containing protein [Rhodospirillaceae bacterium]MBT5939696.1 transporter substrate-binding domain-containing protein [Rhodospirillaceae bacterium]MBT7955464.1 transporter substrate-binding domain-containing protein [Rhodospirillaceae bacterium]